MSVFIAALFAIVIGAGFSFWGYRIFLVFLPIIGFFAGLWLGIEGMSLIFSRPFLVTSTGLVVGFVLGVILAILSYLFYFVGVMIVAAVIGFGLGTGLIAAIGLGSGLIAALVGVVFAVVVVGVVMLFNLQKLVIIVLTAIAGANAILLGILMLFGRVTLGDIESAGSAIQPVLQDSWFWALAWIIVAAIGVFYQIRANRSFAFDTDYYVQNWG